MGGQNREGGKVANKKAPKKAEKDYDEHDEEFLKKQQEAKKQAAAMKAEIQKKGGPLGAGLKKSGSEFHHENERCR